MEFKEGKNCIYLGPDQDHYKAIIQYEDCGQDQVNITHTIVDSSLRGQGVAGKLLEALVEKARKDGFKLRATCSYAKDKLDKTQEYQDVYLG